MKRARPRKTRKLKALGLSDRPGLMKPVAENLPSNQEDEELAVASKFLGALWHLYGIDLFDPQRGKEPADVMCRRRGGSSVELQLAHAGRASISTEATVSDQVAATDAAIAERIRQKLNKKYSRPAGEFWLVVYWDGSQVHGWQLHEAREACSANDGSFDEIWFFYPLPGADLGYAARLWPTVCA